MNTSALERLEERLNQDIDCRLVNAEDKEKFRIEDKEAANWALRKIVKIERERAEARTAAQKEMDRIAAWLAAENKKANQAREYFDNLLEDYHRRVIAENPKAKTIKLPLGDLQLRAQQPEYIRQDDIMLAWAQETHEEFVIIPEPKPQLDWAGLKNTLHIVNGKPIDPATGEIVPGLTVYERPPKFNIKLSL